METGFGSTTVFLCFHICLAVWHKSCVVIVTGYLFGEEGPHLQCSGLICGCAFRNYSWLCSESCTGTRYQIQMAKCKTNSTVSIGTIRCATSPGHSKKGFGTASAVPQASMLRIKFQIRFQAAMNTALISLPPARARWGLEDAFTKLHSGGE